MSMLQAVVLGVVQGVTEWLPVSSEAVLTLIMTRLFGQGAISSVNAAIWLHTGTMLAALAYFRHDFWNLGMHLLKKREKAFDGSENAVIGKFLIVSTFVTGLIGGSIYLLGLKEIVQYPQLFSGLMAAALFLTGILRLYSSDDLRDVLDVGLKDSVFVGFLQGFSILPGVSRSGITSFGFLLRDYDAKDAFRLSFLMSVPAVLAANVGLNLFSGFTVGPSMLVASAVAFFVGYMTIGSVLKIADRAEIAYVCFILGLLALLPVLI